MKNQILLTFRKVIIFTTLALFFWAGLSLIIFSLINAFTYILLFICGIMIIKFFHFMSDDLLKYWSINNKKNNY